MKFCKRPFDFAYLLPGGAVWPCGWMHFEIGNILDQELPDIWHSEAAFKARESILDGSFRYCRKESCPFLENNSLPNLSEEELQSAGIPTEAPVRFNTAFDFTCNHACPSCRESIFKPDTQYTKNVDLTVEKLLPYLNSASELSTNGNGDVFSNPRMLDMLTRLRPTNPDFELMIETNGVLFDEEHWANISHLRDNKILVTITPNSFERDTFKYLSGGDDNVERLLRNLLFIRSLREAGDINFYAVSIVVQDRNFRELPAFTRRCLDEFNVDQVTVKPLYQWFGLKEDVYWFKNIRNPLHPYHKEYLEMMKDPILDDKRVFFWGGKDTLTEPKPHPAYQYQTNQEILLRLLNAERPELLLRGALENAGCRDVAVLAPTDEIALLLARMLGRAGMPPKCFLQRFTPKETEIEHLPVCGFPEMDFNSVDTIVITDSYHFGKLQSDIRNHGFTGKIISFAELTEMIIR